MYRFYKDFNSYYNKMSNSTLISDIFIKDITWNTIINNIDYNIVNQKIIRVTDELGFIVQHTINEKLNHIEDIVSDMKKYFLTDSCTAHYYISFSKMSKTFGKHVDTSDVWFYNAIGETLFTVYEKDNSIKEYHLKSGDMLFVPRGLYHDTRPLTPRVGLSIGLDW